MVNRSSPRVFPGLIHAIGFEVLEAENGSEGLALFSGQQDLNVCVIDVTMPGM